MRLTRGERRRSWLSLRRGLGGKRPSAEWRRRWGAGGGRKRGTAADEARSEAFVRNHPPRRRVSIIRRLCPPAASLSVKRLMLRLCVESPITSQGFSVRESRVCACVCVCSRFSRSDQTGSQGKQPTTPLFPSAALRRSGIKQSEVVSRGRSTDISLIKARCFTTASTRRPL